MTLKPAEKVFEYQAGGSLPPGAPTYVLRQADTVLFEELTAGNYCYVLNSRQMGKSSLRVHTMRRLRDAGISCASVDLVPIGTQSVTPEQWYAGLIRLLSSGLGLTTHTRLNAWWQERSLLTPVQRFNEFLEYEVLGTIRSQVVLFVDEIDSLLSRGQLADDFFALVRYCYNARADNPSFCRLTFSLFGVADPSELISDKNRTPFNVGRAVQLTGFALPEAGPLASGLGNITPDPMGVLREVLAWTGGQPFLTQKVCKLLTQENMRIEPGSESRAVSAVVGEHIVKEWEVKDEPEHLKTIRNRILLSPGRRTARLLSIYRIVLERGSVGADDSPEQMELRLSGLVVERSGCLQVYNPIYAQVFNLSWVEKELASLRPYAEGLNAWLTTSKTDDSRLLRGNALEEAEAWSAGKGLGQEDYEYLAASKDLQNREIQVALEAEKEANRILTRARSQAERRIRHGTLVLLSTILIGGAAAALFWIQAAQARADRQAAESRLTTATREYTNATAEAASARLAANAAERERVRAITQTKRAEELATLARRRSEEADVAARNFEQRIRASQAQLDADQKELAATREELERAKQQTVELRKQADRERDKALQEQKVAEASLLELERQRAIAEARLREIEKRSKELTDKNRK